MGKMCDVDKVYHPTTLLRTNNCKPDKFIASVSKKYGNNYSSPKMRKRNRLSLRKRKLAVNSSTTQDNENCYAISTVEATLPPLERCLIPGATSQAAFIRCLWIDLIIDQCFRNALSREATWIAINLFDRLHDGLLQFAGFKLDDYQYKKEIIDLLACISIAANFVEIYPPGTAALVQNMKSSRKLRLALRQEHVNEHKYVAAIMNAQLKILAKLSWRINPPTLHFWVTSLLEELRVAGIPCETGMPENLQDKLNWLAVPDILCRQACEERKAKIFDLRRSILTELCSVRIIHPCSLQFRPAILAFTLITLTLKNSERQQASKLLMKLVPILEENEHEMSQAFNFVQVFILPVFENMPPKTMQFLLDVWRYDEAKEEKYQLKPGERCPVPSPENLLEKQSILFNKFLKKHFLQHIHKHCSQYGFEFSRLDLFEIEKKIFNIGFDPQFSGWPSAYPNIKELLKNKESLNINESPNIKESQNVSSHFTP